MKRTSLVIGALGAMMMLSACADGGYYGAAYGGPDVYYDGYYGAYTDGYWGPDAAFYYRDGGGRYMRDTGNHFRHEHFHGGRGFHSHTRHDH